MKLNMLRAALALTVSVSALVFARPSAADEPVVPGRSEVAKPPMPTKDSTGLTYTGTVTEVTKDAVTILWPGEKVAKTFAVSETLASGNFPTKGRLRRDGTSSWLSREYRYRLKDVKVGDQVDIHFAHLGVEDICDAICIWKRPGGRVPPLPEGAEDIRPRNPLPPGVMFRYMIPYHEWKNAYWDLEDKGIPYPEKFGPFREFPKAPMPREVKIGPPIAH